MSSDEKHPAKSFVYACPSTEICSDKLLEDIPKIPGLIFQTSKDTIKRAQMFELSTKIHSLFRLIMN